MCSISGWFLVLHIKSIAVNIAKAAKQGIIIAIIPPADNFPLLFLVLILLNIELLLELLPPEGVLGSAIIENIELPLLKPEKSLVSLSSKVITLLRFKSICEDYYLFYSFYYLSYYYYYNII